MSEGKTAKQHALDLSGLLYAPKVPQGGARYCIQANPTMDKGDLNRAIVIDVQKVFADEAHLDLTYDVRNTDRSVGRRSRHYR